MRDDATPVVALENVSFRWPGQTSPTIDIDKLIINAGEHLFVRGASGSGKTTLLNLLAGLHLPTTGHVRLLGVDLADLSSSQRDRFRAEHLGVVFQMFNLLPYLSVLENVMVSRAFVSNRKSDKGRARLFEDRARELLRALNLADAMHGLPVSKLSVGQQQRVAVARALACSPEILIADEPTSALDANNRDRFVELLFQEADASASTLIFVSHDPALATRFSRTVELDSLDRPRGADA